MKKVVVLLLSLILVAVAFAQKPSAAQLAATKTAATPVVQQVPALPVGTAVRMKLETRISTTRNNAGDPFAGRITEPVTQNGKVVIPVGASLQGRIVRVSEPRRVRGLPTIDLRPEMIIMPDGRRQAINAVVVDTDQYAYTDVDDEGRIKGRGHDGDDIKEGALGAGAGAGIGILAGGVKGGLVGAAIGTTATVVHWLVKRRSTDLPAGSEIILELSRPMVVSPATAK